MVKAALQAFSLYCNHFGVRKINLC